MSYDQEIKTTIEQSNKAKNSSNIPGVQAPSKSTHLRRAQTLEPTLVLTAQQETNNSL